MYKCNIVYECIYICTERGYFRVCRDFHSLLVITHLMSIA